MKLHRDSPAAKALGIPRLDDTRHYTSSEKDIFLSIQATDVFLMKDDKPVPSHADYLYRHARDQLDQLRVQHMEDDKEHFLIFALFLNNRIQQINAIYKSSIYLFIRTMRSLDYEGRITSKR